MKFCQLPNTRVDFNLDAIECVYFNHQDEAPASDVVFKSGRKFRLAAEDTAALINALHEDEDYLADIKLKFAEIVDEISSKVGGVLGGLKLGEHLPGCPNADDPAAEPSLFEPEADSAIASVMADAPEIAEESAKPSSENADDSASDFAGSDSN